MGLRSLLTSLLIHPALGVDLFVCRTHEDVSYVVNLSLISEDEARLETWRGWYGVFAAAVCFTKALIQANFRYIRKSDSEYWHMQVHFEQRYLSVLYLSLIHI